MSVGLLADPRVIFVYGRGGHLQLAACEHRPGYAEELRAWKEPQGCRVEVRTLAECRAPTAAPQPEHPAREVVRSVTEWPNPHPGRAVSDLGLDAATFHRSEHFAHAYSWRVACELAWQVAASRGTAEALLFPDRDPGLERTALAFPIRADDLLAQVPPRVWAGVYALERAEHARRQAEIAEEWRGEVSRCPEPAAFGLAGLPWLGADIVHPVIGSGRVSHMLFFRDGAPDVCSAFRHEDHWRPVVVGPRGAALVTPGEWTPAPAPEDQTADHPPAPDAAQVMAEFGADRSYPVDPSPLSAPKASRMLGLFGE